MRRRIVARPRGGRIRTIMLRPLALPSLAMARCEQGYLCRICGLDVAEITESDLYLRYVLGEVPPEQLHLLPECHVRCNPSTAQYIVDPAFPPLVCDGPFAKTLLDAAYVAEEELRVTRAGGGCKNCRLWASRLSTIRFQPLVLILKANQRLIGIEIKHRLSVVRQWPA